MVDLTSLPEPAMIEKVDAEAIIARMAASFIDWAQSEYGIDLTGIIALEGEPLAVQQQFYAAQEASLRAAFNDVLKSNLLAFARGTDLVHLAADHGVEKLEGETDTALRERVVLADQGNSAAGPEEWYEFHARSASALVRDVAVYRTGLGPELAVAVLSSEDGGVPSEALLSSVREAVTSPSVRSINDIVTVVSGVTTIVNVAAEVWLLPDTPVTVFDGLEQGLRDGLTAEGGFGFDVNESWIKAKLMASGVAKVRLTTPSADVVIAGNAAATFGTVTLTYMGRSR